jgi:hypothetical protein
MRRPLDWFVVVISLLVLYAHQARVGYWTRAAAIPDRAPEFGVIARQDARSTMAAASSPFAYVRPDGTELRVPATGIGPRIETSASSSAADLEVFSGSRAARDSRAAVYTWSVPASARIGQ